jgi:nucleotide-binding universal stress UspA family protein
MWDDPEHTGMVVVAAVKRGSRAQEVIRNAAELADALEAELHVVHVGDQYESTEQIRRSSQANPGEPIDTEGPEQNAGEKAEKLGEAVIEDFTPVGLVGYPAQEILAYADQVDARYVVLGGRKQSPVGKALFGSVAQEVVLNADRPVVSVRIA